MELTIFTPTYNRETFLEGLYKSIVCSVEACKSDDSVEWLIIDDGSKTDIEKVVNRFYDCSPFLIKYIKKNNGGKHTAFNLAITRASGDLFVCIDDDDRLTKNAITDIFKLARKYKNTKYVGYVGRVVDENNTLQVKLLTLPLKVIQ